MVVRARREHTVAATRPDPTASDEMARLAGWAAADVPGAAGYWPAQAVANASLGGEGVTDLASAFAAGTLFGEWRLAAAGVRSRWLFTGAAAEGGVLRRADWEVDPAVAEGSGASGSEIVLGAGSVDGFCEQLVSGAVHDGDVFVGLGGTLVVWLTVPGWPEEVPGLWRVPHFVAGKALVGGASTAGGMWVDWVDRALRPDDEAAVEPGDVPVWWPWAKGERVPLHDRSLRVGLAGADISHGPGALRRAAFEATGFVVRHIVELANGQRDQPATLCPERRRGTQPRLAAGHCRRARDFLSCRWLSRMGRHSAPRSWRGWPSGPRAPLTMPTRWARWSPPVEPRPAWAAAAEERYVRWKAGLPETSAAGLGP